MKISIYLYYKFFVSFFICISTSFVIFYIFSLLGNLNENLSFSDIIYLSFLNSIQIFTYIPSLLIILSILLFSNLLRSRNELLVLKTYLNYKKLSLIFLPLILCFTFIEINKNSISMFINEIKSDLTKDKKGSDIVVIIDKKDNLKTYTVLKSIDNLKNTVEEFYKYELDANFISLGEYSRKLNIKNNNLITNEYVKFQFNQFEVVKGLRIIDLGFDKLLFNNFILNRTIKGQKIKININNLRVIIFQLIFYYCIFLLLFNKKNVDRKQSNFNQILLISLLLVYSILVTNLKLNTYDSIFHFMSILMIFFVSLKFIEHE